MLPHNRVNSLVALLLAGLASLGWSASSPRPANSEPNASAPGAHSLTAPGPEPNLWPAELTSRQRTALETQPRPQPIAAPAAPAPYWQVAYHPQVTPQVFAALGYPYHPGGQPYVTNPPDGAAARLADSLAAAPGPLDPNRLADDQLLARQAGSPGAALQTCCDLIHQWRAINESLGVTLEVVRSIELTRRETGIYYVQPKLAVTVKRTLGRLGQVNRDFDRLSRLALEKLLAGEVDRVLLARLDKQLTDLQALLAALAEQDDQVAITLGIGRIRRDQPAAADPIDYTNRSLSLAPSGPAS